MYINDYGMVKKKEVYITFKQKNRANLAKKQNSRCFGSGASSGNPELTGDTATSLSLPVS
jgi:hypothetical protein